MSSLAAYGVNDPRISTPDWYAEHNLKWIPTDAIPAVEGGWRLDVGIDSPSGTVRAVRLVPMNKEQTDVEIPKDAAATAAKIMRSVPTLRDLAEQSAAAVTVTLPKALQAAVDELRWPNGTAEEESKRPRGKTLAAVPWHEVITEIAKWAAENGHTPSVVVADAFGVSRPTGVRYVAEAKEQVEEFRQTLSRTGMTL